MSNQPTTAAEQKQVLEPSDDTVTEPDHFMVINDNTQEATMPDQNPTSEPTPNAWRRLLAEIFADAEDHGLGTWGPAFQAHPDKTDAACAFVETRTALLAAKRLIPAASMPDLGDVDHEDLNVLSNAMQEVTAEVMATGANASDDEIGLAAWNRLTPEQQRTTVGAFLTAYAGRTLDAERERAGAAIAELATYLIAGDDAMAWRALNDSEGQDGTVVDREVLLRVLCELELLRRRTTPSEATP